MHKELVSAPQSNAGDQAWTRLEFVLDTRIRDCISNAQHRVDALILDSDLYFCYFNDYGSEWIRDVGA